MSDALAPVEGQMALPEPDDNAFAALLRGGETLAGRTVVDKAAMLAIPFVITAVTFRYARKLQTGDYRDYVSLECQVFPRRFLEELRAKGRIKQDIDSLSVYPGETIVINDGSTGVRRQVVQFLHDRGAIIVADPDTVKSAGMRAYDRPYWDWSGEFQEANANTPRPEYPELRIELAEEGLTSVVIRGGLTVSEYTNEYTEEGRTYYLA